MYVKPREHLGGFKTQIGDDLGSQIRMYAQKYKKKMRLFIPMFSKEFAEELIYNTPYISGFLRGSWMVGFHSNLRKVGTFDAEGTRTLVEIATKINSWVEGQNIYFMNTARYSFYVERGTSKMAPRYYIKRSIHAAPHIARKVARRLSSMQ